MQKGNYPHKTPAWVKVSDPVRDNNGRELVHHGLVTFLSPDVMRCFGMEGIC